MTDYLSYTSQRLDSGHFIWFIPGRKHYLKCKCLFSFNCLFITFLAVNFNAMLSHEDCWFCFLMIKVMLSW
jgi:hypothetical protein